MLITKQFIKNKILSKNINNNIYFIDNEYLDKYCDLIFKNITTKKQPLVTQKHHVIPLCYYKLINNIKLKNWRREADHFSKNDENILTNLLYKDHILAHFYLVMFSNDFLYYNLFNSLDWQLRLNTNTHIKNNKETILKLITELNLDNYQELYEKYKQKERIQIKCIETQKIFKSLVEAYTFLNKKYDFKKCFENPFLTCGGYHWVKIGDEKTEKLLNNFVGKPPNKNNDYKQKTTKKVICIETQEIFKTPLEASLKYFNSPWGVDVKTGFTKGYHWAYLDDLKKQEELKDFIGKPPETPLETKQRLSYIQKTREHRKLTENEKEVIGKRSRKSVICIETQEIFKSISEAYLKYKPYKVTQGGICMSCHTKNKIITSGGYHWAYVNDLKRQDDLKEFVGKERSSLTPQQLATQKSILKKFKPLICIELQKIFNSNKEINEFLNISSFGYCKETEYQFGYHWSRLDDLERLEKYKSFIGKPRLNIRPATLKNSKKVICCELNKIFDSAKEAAVSFNLNYNKLWAICSGRIKNNFYGGYTWKYLE